MERNSSNSNSDLNKLALDVLKHYNIAPENISVIQSGSIKTVWKVNTKDGYVCLKRLKQSYDKALFSVNAQIYVKKSGGNVPGILLSEGNQPIVRYNDQLFVVYEWIPGSSLDFNNNDELPPSIHGLAAFHKTSKGYVAPDTARVSSKLGKWPEQYNSMKSRMTEWKEISKSNLSQPYHSTYMKYVDSIIDMCDVAVYMLERSSYKELCLPSSDSIVLCHQDYGKGNALLTDNGVFVLDLDGVTFDLPARDLRKIIGKRAENKNQWDVSSIRNILKLYSEVSPLTEAEKVVLYIDLSFPHWFFGLVKNMFQSNKALKPSEIERIAKLENSKLPLLNNFLKRGE